VITGISAVSALFISVITLGGFVNAAFELEDPLTSWLGGIDLGDAGLLLVGLFVVAWGVSAWRARSAPSARVEPEQLEPEQLEPGLRRQPPR
jgi:high-affinity nickel-transport protein